ncbi:MAG: aldose 1-epimerase family protein [Hymenobacter sp.]|nr:MAG: aldose 1-epimerase family protein [Hymenobacter sp.]
MPTYALQNDQCRVRVHSHGAELTSFQRRDLGDLEYMWQADPAQWRRHAPLLFPIVGRLPEDTYLHKGHTYKLPQHGFARDQEFTLIHEEETSLTLQLVASAASRAVFPFEFDLRVRYELRGTTLTVGWQVRNPAAAPHELLFSIGAHPAFRCPLLPGERFEDYYFAFDHPVTVERQLLQGGLRSGETQPVPLANGGTELPLTGELFADDALVFSYYDFTRLTLRTHQSARAVRVAFAGFPYLGLWTKSARAGFVCIEPWQGVASAVGAPGELADKEGILTLAPGQEFTASYSIEAL